MTSYADFFRRATGHEPYPYQERLASGETLSGLLSVPTGAGKTAAAVLAWLWRRRHAAHEVARRTPRRLAYCLPMRSLVEQTERVTREVLTALDIPVVDWAAAVHGDLPAEAVGLAMAMGGEPRVDWDLFPDLDLIVIGTQDMLLSRALNRGYGASRYRWPLAFGLLNNDALWVHDEVQLMGDGLATSTQLAGLRRLLGAWGPISELWMSATMRRDWLASVDFADFAGDLPLVELGDDDLARDVLRRRLHAAKRFTRLAGSAPGDVAEAALEQHHPGDTTLVILNTVVRATDVYREVRRRLGDTSATGAETPDVTLLHSRFRPPERRAALSRAVEPCPPGGRIVVATQVVEAGVDMTSHSLVTDLAPWPSLVQRLGRCNRGGEYDDAVVAVVGLDPGQQSAPYEPDELTRAGEVLDDLGEGADLSPAALAEVSASRAADLLQYEPEHVLRRRDLVDLFDTTPDIAGNDIDVSRFIRNVKETDAYLFWCPGVGNGSELGDIRPGRDELCPVPPGKELRQYAERARDERQPLLVWDHLAGARADGAWVPVDPGRIRPGAVYLADSSLGGYSPETGWDPKSKQAVAAVELAETGGSDVTEADGDDAAVEVAWQTLSEHTDAVVAAARQLVERLRVERLWLTEAEKVATVLEQAARWHDRGKAHPVFQGALERPEHDAGTLWAKAPPGAFRRYERYGFRHELAGALAARDAGLDAIVWYLVAAHHGKVRLGLRALPDENRSPGPGRLAVRGVLDGDVLPETPLGDGIVAPQVTLSLRATELGRDDAGRPGWIEAVIGLCDGWPGPFRLAFLEALLRSADIRASAAGGDLFTADAADFVGVPLSGGG